MSKKTRCVLLFARSPKQESLAKGLGRATALFEFARRRVADAVASLDDVELFVPGQHPGSFCQKLEGAFEEARGLGYEQIVAVPIDTPGLGAGDLADAFEALRTHTLVLGPSPDGGVYLLGLRAQCGAIARFGEIRWLTSRVATDLMACFAGAAVLSRVIADLDSRTDLGRLRHDAQIDPELSALLVTLLAGSGADFPERSIIPRIPPAGRRSGRAPPALLTAS